MHTTRVEISETAVSHNIKSFQTLLQADCQMATIIKSNGYGHGILEMAEICTRAGIKTLGVNSLDEALLLRQNFLQQTILIMGDISHDRQYLSKVADPNFQIIVSRPQQVAELTKLGKNRPQIHLKIDTGMGRLGHSGLAIQNVLQQIHRQRLPLDGICSHFASTEDNIEHSYTRQQLEDFLVAIDYARSLGYDNLIRHCAASASTLLFPQAHFDMVRIGISLYGLWPSQETRFCFDYKARPHFTLKPVLSWKTKIVHIQTIERGKYIGYGSTFKTSYPSKIAVIPVGYHEGLDRRLSNQGYVLTKGERAQIVGRICMNMTMLDVTHIDQIQPGDDVILIGTDGKEEIQAQDHASITGTINYDIVTRIQKDIPRIITN